MANVMEYKCPCCGGAIAFDSKTQNMKCPYCDTEFDPEALSENEQETADTTQDNMNWDTSPGADWQEGEEEALRAYICNSCGGEIVSDENTAATSCPFCGNPVIMTERLSGLLKPDFIIPFKIDKKAAKEALSKHYHGKKLLPKIFKDENHIDEVKGIYVPFWLFDTDANADIRYRATRVRAWSDSNYTYRETSFYAIHRSGSLGFERVPVDGSEKMADDLMESIEPFNFSDAVDFKTAYLSGYLADKYDVDAKQSVERANKRIKASTEAAFASTIHGYTSVTPEYSNISLRDGKAKYALYPVWLLNTTWNGQKCTFAMNGQTGKFAGDLPLDKSAYFKWLAGLSGIISAVTMALLYLIWLF